MALTIKNLSSGYLPTGSNGPILAGTANKSKLVKNIILTNKHASAQTITLYAKILTAVGPTFTEFAITPIDLTIPSKGQVVLDSEITLQSTTVSSTTELDSLTGKASIASEVSYVINGMERDI